MTKAKLFVLLRQLLLASTLSAGFATVWLLFALIASTIVLEVWAGPEADWPPREQVVVKADGTLLVKSTPRANPLSVAYHDSSGREQPAPAADALTEGVYLMGGSWTRSSWPVSLDPQSYLKPFKDPNRGTVCWYFIHNKAHAGAGYFAGYDRANNARIGFISESGFRTDRPPSAEQFPVSSPSMSLILFWSSARSAISQGSVIDLGPIDSPLPSNWVLVPSGNRLRLVDLSTRMVRTAFQAADPIESFAFLKREAVGKRANASREPSLVVRTSRAIVVLDPNLDAIRTWVLPDDSLDANLITLYELGGSHTRAEIQQEVRIERGQILAPRIVYQVGPDGTTQSRVELALHSGMQIWSKQRTAAVLGYALPAPLVLPLAHLFFVLVFNQPASFVAAVQSMLQDSWPSLLAVTALALLLAIAAWRRARAFALPALDQAAWVFFVFVFGIPGYVGYRLHRRWPLRAECPQCHARPPRDRTACAACHSPFPAPAEQGIEVFA